ncbi:MAG: MOSC domain-containing protein [Proteobacteria bacterium]|nr:MOSC domain-containing protein [Pseudomonadota bacterium]
MQATVSKLNIFPLKSGRALPLVRRMILSTERGVEFDRRYMLVTAHDDQRLMVTQRTPGMTGMATVGVDIASQEAGTYFRDFKTDRFVAAYDPNDVATQPQIVHVHGKPIGAFDAGDRVAEELSAHFGRKLRLMKLFDDNARAVDPDFARPVDRVGFADGFAVMLATTPSLEQVRHWSNDGTITMADFRPNIEIDGDFAPFAEDGWKRVRIGEVELEFVKPCSRCIIPEIVQSTGVKRDNKQPTASLHEFRRAGKARYFGENALIIKGGIIHPGDTLEVLEHRTGLHPLLEGVKFTGLRL